MENPLSWALSLAIVLLSLAVFIHARRMKEVRAGLSGIHISLNGHPSGESLGVMVFETRELAHAALTEGRDHRETPANEAHPPRA